MGAIGFWLFSIPFKSKCIFQQSSCSRLAGVLNRSTPLWWWELLLGLRVTIQLFCSTFQLIISVVSKLCIVSSASWSGIYILAFLSIGRILTTNLLCGPIRLRHSDLPTDAEPPCGIAPAMDTIGRARFSGEENQSVGLTQLSATISVWLQSGAILNAGGRARLRWRHSRGMGAR